MRLRFGTFIAPFHPPEHNPTLSLESDLDLLQHLDKLGFDEAWIGEHHSAGSEIIASPELHHGGGGANQEHSTRNLMPRFQGTTNNLIAAADRATASRPELADKQLAAIETATARYEEEQAALSSD